MAKVTVREGFLDDWLLLEPRIADSDVEGSPDQWAALAEAIRQRGAYHARRCAVEVQGDRVALWSPRNSRGRAGIVTLAEADALVESIEAALRAREGGR